MRRRLDLAQGLPPVLQWVAGWNPLSTMVLSCRQLFGNDLGQTNTNGYWSLERPVAYTLISCGVLLALFIPLAVRKYRTSTAHQRELRKKPDFGLGAVRFISDK